MSASIIIMSVSNFVGDFDELKQDISSFRYEMLNHLSRSQRETKDNTRRLDVLQDNLANLIVLQNAVLKTVHPNYADDPKLNIKEEVEEAQKKRKEDDAAGQQAIDDTYPSLRSRRQSRLGSIQEETHRQQSPSNSIKRTASIGQGDVQVEISPGTKDTHITSQRL